MQSLSFRGSKELAHTRPYSRKQGSTFSHSVEANRSSGLSFVESLRVRSTREAPLEPTVEEVRSRETSEKALSPLRPALPAREGPRLQTPNLPLEFLSPPTSALPKQRSTPILARLGPRRVTSDARKEGRGSLRRHQEVRGGLDLRLNPPKSRGVCCLK